jgi:hypothetical protein
MIVRSPLIALALLAACPWPAAAAEPPADRPFAVTVVDDQTGRGVPLVELRTVNEIRLWTDSNGVVAFREPGLMNQKVYFHIRSHGYEVPADGFGYRGAALDVKPGGSATVKIRRLNIAERLYRLTGQGIYADSLLAGRPVPLRQPVLNGKVLGQDSVNMTEYRGKLFWLWGDTNRPGYPLGHFGTAGATSKRPADGLDPAKGVDYDYYVDADGFSRPICPEPKEGIKWLCGLATVPDEAGKERLVAHFWRMKNLGEAYERGVVLFNDQTEVFDPVTRLPPDELNWPFSQTFKHKTGGTEHVYFAAPYPHVRVKADLASFKDPRAYEAFTPLKPGTRFRKGKPAELDRDAGGKLVWAWKKDTDPLWEGTERELVKSGAIQADEARYNLADAAGGKRITAHGGSVAYNAFRKRWIFVFVESGGSSSYLGEVWVAEADAPEGPWRRARKVATHEQYTFYNVAHHPLFDQEGGRVIHFEGTYTAAFSGSKDLTPRYDYNQVMYRLDLADPRLKLNAE